MLALGTQFQHPAFLVRLTVRYSALTSAAYSLTALNQLNAGLPVSIFAGGISGSLGNRVIAVDWSARVGFLTAGLNAGILQHF